jgi:hypothetical protein
VTRKGPNGEVQELMPLERFAWMGKYIAFRPCKNTPMA